MAILGGGRPECSAEFQQKMMTAIINNAKEAVEELKPSESSMVDKGHLQEINQKLELLIGDYTRKCGPMVIRGTSYNDPKKAREAILNDAIHSYVRNKEFKRSEVSDSGEQE